jgi:hypothetical protein
MKTNLYRVEYPNYSKPKGTICKSWLTKNAAGEIHRNTDRAYATPVTKAEAEAHFAKIKQNITCQEWKLIKETV